MPRRERGDDVRGRLLRLWRGARFLPKVQRRQLVHPWNCLANQPLDGADGLAVDRRDDSDRSAAPARPAGAADTMNVIIRVMRHIEIEDVAHLRDIEAARRNVRGN